MCNVVVQAFGSFISIIRCCDQIFFIQVFCVLSSLKSRFQVKSITNTLDKSEYFSSLVEDMKQNKERTKRTVIYCRQKKECGVLLERMLSKLGNDGFVSGKERQIKYQLLQKFTHDTPSSTKKHILEQVGDINGHIRIVICTSAFGMGVDMKGFSRCFHFGPPEALEEFIQETGRIGRDGSPSVSVLLFSTTKTAHSSPDMVEYCQLESCRREFVMEKFPGEYSFEKNCSCCDVCASKCLCSNPDCGDWCKSKKEVDKTSVDKKRQRKVSMEQREKIREVVILSFKNVAPYVERWISRKACQKEISRRGGERSRVGFGPLQTSNRSGQRRRLGDQSLG